MTAAASLFFGHVMAIGHDRRRRAVDVHPHFHPCTLTRRTLHKKVSMDGTQPVSQVGQAQAGVQTHGIGGLAVQFRLLNGHGETRGSAKLGAKASHLFVS